MLLTEQAGVQVMVPEFAKALSVRSLVPKDETAWVMLYRGYLAATLKDLADRKCFCSVASA